MRFYQKLQGYHAQVSKDFVLNFFATNSEVVILSLKVSPKNIAQATKIPRSGEEWFKATKFKLHNWDEFLKQEHVAVDMTSGIPRSRLKENY